VDPEGAPTPSVLFGWGGELAGGEASAPANQGTVCPAVSIHG